jgi:hypothetical protein
MVTSASQSFLIVVIESDEVNVYLKIFPKAALSAAAPASRACMDFETMRLRCRKPCSTPS